MSYQTRKEQVIAGVCDDVRKRLNPETAEEEREQWLPLKEIIMASLDKNMDQHIKVLLSNSASSSSSSSSSTTTSSNSSNKGVTISKGNVGGNNRSVAWAEWQKTNNGKGKYPNPETGAEMTGWDYWQEFVWKKMSETEKKKYSEVAKQIREQKKTESGSSEKEEKTKNAFQLFHDVHKQYYDKKDKFFDPETNGQTSGWAIVGKIWTKVVKDNKEMVAPYNSMKDKLKNGTEDYSEDLLKRLPHLNFDVVRRPNWKFEELKMID